MHVKLIDPDATEWVDVLAKTPHDIYHLPEYVRVAAQHEKGRPSALFAQEGEYRLLLPLLLRPITTDLSDAASPYGYPGPLITGAIGEAEPFALRALRHGMELLRRSDMVSLFVRLNPLLWTPLDSLGQIGTIVDQGPTVSVDLTASLEEIWRQTRRDHRNQVSKAQRLGHTAYIDEGWGRFEEFVEIYTESMRRVGAADSYYFSTPYFSALRDALGPRVHLCAVEIGGEIAAAGLFTEVSGIVEFHLSGTRNKFLRERPSKLMLDYVRRWAKARGNRCLHLGGGLGSREDELFAFKAGFSQIRHRYRTWRVVLDAQRYQALVRDRHPQGPAQDLTGFFPAYRAETICGNA